MLGERNSKRGRCRKDTAIKGVLRTTYQQVISHTKDYRLTKLLLAVEPEIPNNDDELAQKRNPEGR